MRALQTKAASASPTPSGSGLLEVAAYLLVGIVLPAAAWSLALSIPVSQALHDGWIAQITASNLAICYTLRQLRSYAKTRLLSYVIPVNAIVFGAVFTVNSLARTETSWSLFLACGFFTLAVSYLNTIRLRRISNISRDYVIPGGEVGNILGRRGFTELRSPSQLEQLIADQEIAGAVVADLHHDLSPEWERAIARAALKGIPVYHYRLIEEELTGEVRISHLRENDLGSLMPNLPYRKAKRLIDVVAAVVLAPFLLTLMALIALLIRLDGPGPIFFRQERLGYRGEFFTMVKFRTMREREVEDDEHARRDDAITRSDDSRVTRIGKILRKTRMDELPQVWNILRGEMSWIGPRPEARALARWYQAEIPFYDYRHIVRPGITGWAQVNQGHVAELDAVHTKLRLDFYYVKNLSLWLDVLIALKTLRVVFGGIGAK
ncbi:sugar transferase [Porphyrobacter sp. LM 6]|uniref:sugar transferase n=1 Tax=Porphyrobacter sp. LM 6 TaxID=1896196 RepID=UPI000847B823|nr:sugar transferase [Porphyrobacter sp. LM 6]AOL93026.1 Sugar transferase involved in LPS biosynthesis (colanic, teichoic acid) [Porphyrobacter sp. LM 6]